MSSQVGLSLLGVPELKEALENIKDGAKQRTMKKAINAVAKVGAKKAKEKLRRKRTRQLYRSLGMRPKSYQRGKVFIVVIGPRRGFKIIGPDGKPVNPTQYAHLVERGRAAVTATGSKYLTWMVTRGRGKGRWRKVRQVKAVAGTPFMGDALEYMRLVGPWIAKEVMTTGLAQEVAKAEAKGKSAWKKEWVSP